ncbi:hypothetical protein VQH23_00325 [Pararoseomonas sp. SCSIO 73927]|uniref:hypothetical protein n=1 Tax=Pararoseomonas sp. SCSIO 73927 TaxID=3114537 RepID=UPI0030CD3C3B
MRNPEAATDLIHRIGGALVRDPDVVELPWEALALVVTVEPGVVSTSGYAYDERRRPIAFTPSRGSGLVELFRELQEATSDPGGRRWAACLVQVRRATGKMTMQYEYDDVDRWKVTPDNLDTMRAGLCPAE